MNGGQISNSKIICQFSEVADRFAAAHVTSFIPNPPGFVST